MPEYPFCRAACARRTKGATTPGPVPPRLWSRSLDTGLFAPGLGLAVAADGGALLQGTFNQPVALDGQAYIRPPGGYELLFMRFGP